MGVIKVLIADSNIAIYPDSIKTLGLGSCVGVTLYDEVKKIGGMAHVMLPSTELAKTADFKKAKYGDTALPELVEMMVTAGANRYRLKAKMAGGAQMFKFAGSADTLRIGPRNVDSCKAALKKLGIPLLAEDTGGSHGRTIELFTETGDLQIKTATKTVKVL